MTAHPVIELKDISYVYPNGTMALKGVSLAVSRGDCLAIVGPNGGGKSTLLMVMAGLLAPTSGMLRILGKSIDSKMIDNSKQMYSLRKRMAMVFQDPDVQLFSSTVFDDIAFGPRHLGLADDEVKKKVEDILRFLGLEHIADKHPYELSSGEKRKAAVATAMVLSPDILIFDEPTADLDPKSRKELLRVIRGLHEKGKTIVVSTHDMNVIPELAERTVVLEREIIAEGTVREMFLNEEVLRKANLDVPNLSRLFRLLESFGFPCKNLPLTMDDAVRSLRGLVDTGEGKIRLHPQKAENNE